MTSLETGLMVNAGKTFIDRVIGKLEKKVKILWQKFDWTVAQGRYFEKIERDYGWTKFLGKNQPIKLQDIFTDVYLLEPKTALNYFDITKLKSNPNIANEKLNRLSGLDFVKSDKNKRIFILGKPGAGKTTFLKYMALECANGKIRKIPIFISLKEWGDSGANLIDFLINQFDICGFPDSKLLIEHFLETGQALVLFDGLDETQQTNGIQDRLIDSLRNFSRKYDDTQILITCRIAATNYLFEQFNYLEVADFTEKQVMTFVAKWFDNDLNAINQFNKEFNAPDNKSLREMSNTPLLLSLLCLYFEETLSFPQRRIDIYEASINALLHKWDASRNIKRDEIYKGLSIGRKRQMFAQVANQTFIKNEYFIRQNVLEKYIANYLIKLTNIESIEEVDFEAILKAIEAQHGILSERASNVYSFSHLTIQEYFTAKYICENTEKGTIKELLKLQNIIDSRWWEVIVNTSGMLDDANSFIETFNQSIRQIVLNEKKIHKLINWCNAKGDGSNNANYKILNIYIILAVQCLSEEIGDERNSLLSILNNLTQLIKLFWKPKKGPDSAQLAIARAFHISGIYELIDLFFTSDFIDENLELEIRIIYAYFYSSKLYQLWEVEEIRELLIYFKLYWNETTDKISDKKKDELANISLSLENPSKNDWKLISDCLLNIIKDYGWNFDWNFSQEELAKIEIYTKANLLLIKCLESATVTNRQTIKNNLFMLN